jgi:hypothetical protein
MVAKLGDDSGFAENVDGTLRLDLFGQSQKLLIDWEKQTVSRELAGP